jgi:hypothetical protein
MADPNAWPHVTEDDGSSDDEFEAEAGKGV